MTDRPILFSAPMIRALLAGTKTQTRRVLNPQPLSGMRALADKGIPISVDDFGAIKYQPLRFAVGDRLWVREAWRTFISLNKEPPRDLWSPDKERGTGVRFEAGGGLSISRGIGRPREYTYSEPEPLESAFGKFRPGMHLPRWGSRMTLGVTGVKVERLQDISDVDAIAEGIVRENVIVGMYCTGGRPSEVTADRYFFDGCHDEGYEDPVDAYAGLWEHINGKGSWAANPWVVAVSSTVEQRNIDDIKVVA